MRCDSWWDDLRTKKWGKVCKLIINCEHKLCVCVCVYNNFVVIFNRLDIKIKFQISKAPKSFFLLSAKGLWNQINVYVCVFGWLLIFLFFTIIIIIMTIVNVNISFFLSWSLEIEKWWTITKARNKNRWNVHFCGWHQLLWVFRWFSFGHVVGSLYNLCVANWNKVVPKFLSLKFFIAKYIIKKWG